ncbi:MAG TPA: sensor histidine kinase [Bauldia sp.]|nr:sensor histidine kinase [Bauldia sp.]
MLHPAADGFDPVAEANHRFANHLAMLSGLARLHSDRLAKAPTLSPAEAAQSLVALSAKIEAIAKLHKMLANPREQESIELGPYLTDVVTGVVESLSQAGAIALSLSLDVACRIDPSRALSIALIVCEMVTNSMKYAHPSGVAGRLSVRCVRTGAYVVIEVEDDGVGLPPGFDPAGNGHVGFRVVRSLTEQLDATMKFHSDELGVTFTLEVPFTDIGMSLDKPLATERRIANGA